MSTSVKGIPVPSSGFGSAVDVSSLVGEKTVVLSGRFRGAYVLYGSHQSGPGAHFAPLLIFDAGGVESIKQTFKASLSQVRLKSLATGAAGVSANISGLEVPGDNSFTSLAVGGEVDLGTDAYQVDLNFMGFGQVNGVVVVEGSADGVGFNPIGEFASQGSVTSLLGGGSGIEFSPIVTSDKIRYVRLRVQGSVAGGFVVTVGGAVSEGGGGAGTLSATYDAGRFSADQTLTIADAKGGAVIFDVSGGLFEDDAVQVLGPGGIGVGFLVDGGMELGPDAINIQEVGWPANTVGLDGIAIGGWVVAGDNAVVIGARAAAPGYTSVSVGPFAVSGSGAYNTVIGASSRALGVGTNNTCVGAFAVVGDPSLPSETRDFSGNVRVGGGDALYASLSVAIGNNVQIGETTDSEIVDSCVAIGNSPSIGGTVGGVPINNGIAIGKGAVIVNIVDVEGNSGTTNNAIAIGTGASTSEEGSIAIGNGASVAFIQSEGADATGDIAIGNGAVVDSFYGGVVAIGQGANALGGNVHYSVVVGAGATVDQVGCVAVGWDAHGFGTSGVAVGSFSKGGEVSVSLGRNSDTSTVKCAIAIGDYSQVTGDYGMAFGRKVVAGANEVVFGSSDNGLAEVVKFRAVSGLASFSDLFTFDQSLVGSPDATSMKLLIQTHTGGTIVSVPVTLSAIDIYGNSYLQVANS